MNKYIVYPGKWKIYLAIIILMNLVIRILIYDTTILLSFADYQSYFGAVDYIRDNGSIKLASGNSLFAISYLGYYAKYLIGNISYFFWFQCLLGSLTTLIVSLLTIRISGNIQSGLITAIILTLYTEFMVFSSVFYTPVIMLFLLSVFSGLIYYYLLSSSLQNRLIYLTLILFVFLLTFLFKPELVFLPFFLMILALAIYKKKALFRKTLIVSAILLVGGVIVKLFGIYDKKENEVLANDFIFFGHTDYGGDGGEGAFIYPDNKDRYDKAWQEYCVENNLKAPTLHDRNRFQASEIKRFIFQQPIKWAGIQFTKFLRTFGVVPESTSFKILYTGLLKDRLWLTSIVVVAPVALIILLFIIFFNLSSLKKLFNTSTFQSSNSSTLQLTTHHSPLTTHRLPLTGYRLPITANNDFIYIYVVLFIYYLIATIFFGHYQERYRIPVMVLFIIPMLGYFMATFNKMHFFNKVSLSIKGGILVLLLVFWTFQVKESIQDKERFQNALRSVNVGKTSGLIYIKKGISDLIVIFDPMFKNHRNNSALS